MRTDRGRAVAGGMAAGTGQEEPVDDRREAPRGRTGARPSLTGWAGPVLGFGAGCAILALGIVLTVKANLGPPSWDVLHLAIGRLAGLTLGRASMLTSGLVILLVLLMRGAWTVRWGTVANSLLVGWAIDVFLGLGVPDPQAPPIRALFLAAGVVCIALGSVVYTRTGLGAGARDGLILVLSQRLPLTVGRIRLLLEALVVLVGWLLGGPVGAGTLLVTLGTGPIADVLFRFLGRGRLPATVRIPEPPVRRQKAS